MKTKVLDNEKPKVDVSQQTFETLN